MKLCDGTEDCDDRSDELGCQLQCQSNEFKCKSGKNCLPNQLKCNGIDECDDKSDEENCFGHVVTSPNRTRCSDQFDCQSTPKQCVDWNVVCDSKVQCSNAYDESPIHCEFQNPCKTSDCSHQCVRRSAESFVCECDLGFELLSNGKQCQTSHSDRVMALVLDQDVLLTHSLLESSPNSTRKALHSASTMAVSVADQLLFWFDSSTKQLLATAISELLSDDDGQSGQSAVKARSNNSTLDWFVRQKSASSAERIVLLEHVHISDLLVDSEHALLYFLESSKHQLEVLSLESGACHVLVKTEQTPISLVLMSSERTLYWLEAGEEPRIEAIDQDGNNKRTILSGSSQLGRPVSLAINAHEHRLYWVDALQHAVSYVQLRDNRVQRAMVDTIRMKSPTWLDVLGEHLLWSDSSCDSVFSVNLLQSEAKVSVVLDRLSDVKTVRLLHKNAIKMSTGSETCRPTDDRTCSYLCLPGNHLHPDRPARPKSTCVCPLGQSVSFDGFSCETPQVLVAQIVSTQNTRLMLIAIILIIASALSTIAAFFVLGAYLNSVRRQRVGSALYRQVGEGDPLQCKQYNFDIQPVRHHSLWFGFLIHHYFNFNFSFFLRFRTRPL
jgi:hypothetical protein